MLDEDRPDATALRSKLDYDPATGVFRWRVAGPGRQIAGSRAGSVKSDGYRRISFGGRLWYAQHLAWLHFYGVWVDDQLDHRNRDRDDNRIDNLRPATPSQNRQNQVPPNGGVSRHGRGWRARITIAGSRRDLGIFDTRDEAVATYFAAKRVHHDFWEG